MKFFKTKKSKIVIIILSIIFFLYLILVISRIDISRGTISNIRDNYVSVIIGENPYWFTVNNTLILDENNKKISLSTLKPNDNILILNYNWRGWVYQAVASIPPEIYNVWFVKLVNE